MKSQPGRPWRILWVAGVACELPSTAANSIQTMKVADAFAASGHRVTVLAPNRRRLATDPYTYYGTRHRFPIVRCPVWGGPGRASTALLAWHAVQHARRRAYDLVLTRAGGAALALGRAGIVHTFEMHRLPSQRRLDRRHQPLLRSPLTEAVVVLNETLLDPLAAAGLDRQKCVVLPDAADQDAPPRGELGRRALAKLGAKAGRFGRPVALYAGSLNPLKGAERIAQIARRCPWIDFVLVGGTASELAAYKQRTSIPANLETIGALPPNRVRALLAAADVLLIPHTEASEAHFVSPLKVYEALWSGRPIVASDLAATRSGLEDGVNALLVPPSDLDAWSAALRRVVADRDLAARLGRGARTAAERYTWDDRARQLVEHVAKRRATRRRVAHLIASFQPAIGGAERQAEALARQQATCGDEVWVVTRRRSGWPAVDGRGPVGIRRVGWPALGSAGYVIAACAWLRRQPAFAVHHAHQARAQLFAAVIARRQPTRAVVKFTGGDVPVGRGLRARLRRWALRRADRRVAVSKALAETAARGLAPVDVIGNGVDTTRFRPGPPADRNQVTVVYVGRLEPVKGVDILLEAWARLAPAHPSARLEVVGDGSAVPAGGLPPGVTCVGQVADPLPTYQRADLLVLPSRDEGLPNALLEGMACGLAAVATRVGAVPEVVEDEVSGLVVEPEAPAALAEAIAALLRDPERRQRMGEAARQRVVERFGLESIERAWARLYTD